jgi:Trm5-related predicted tRNA methylase
MVQPYRIVIYGFSGATKQEMQRSFPGYTNWLMCEFKEEPLESYDIKSQPIYLSADSEQVVANSLSPNTAFIIGGLVDRNRYKVSKY